MGLFDKNSSYTALNRLFLQSLCSQIEENLNTVVFDSGIISNNCADWSSFPCYYLIKDAQVLRIMYVLLPFEDGEYLITKDHIESNSANFDLGRLEQKYGYFNRFLDAAGVVDFIESEIGADVFIGDTYFAKGGEQNVFNVANHLQIEGLGYKFFLWGSD